MAAHEASVVAIALGIFVSMLAWGLVALRIMARRRFDLPDIFLLTVGTVYGLACSFIIWATQSGRNPGGIRIIGRESDFWIIPVVGLMLVLGCLALSTFAAGRERNGFRAGRVAARAARLARADWQAGLAWLGWLFLAVAVLASVLYTRAYGGFAGFLEVAGALRAGMFEEADANPLSFLKPFGGFALFASYLFAAGWIASPSRRRMNAAGFLVALAVASVTLLGWGGRVDLLVYWLTLVFGAMVYRFGVRPRLLGGAAALLLVMLFLLPPVTSVMNPGKVHGSFVTFFAAELTFPLESPLHALDLQDHRRGVDLLAAPLFILPERVWGDLVTRTVSDLNSDALLGDTLRYGSGFTIPADIMTFGLYQFGLPGPLLIAALWYLFLARIDGWLIARMPRSISAFLYSHAVFSVAALSVLYFDPKMQITRNFHFILGLVAVLAIPRLWPRRTARRAPRRAVRRI